MEIEINGNGAESWNVLGASILVIISTNNNIPFYIEFSIVILLSRTHLNTRVPPTSDIPLQHIRNGYLLPNDGMLAWVCYKFGDGVKRGNQTLSKSCPTRISYVLCRLSDCYKSGDGVSRDDEEVTKQGHTEA